MSVDIPEGKTSDDSLVGREGELTPSQAERIANYLADMSGAILEMSDEVRETQAMKTAEHRSRAEFWQSLSSLVGPRSVVAVALLLLGSGISVWVSYFLVDHSEDVRLIIDATYCR